eukprot:TRINITY_DN87192_c0_g1_i1.p1 TRINITY_DN87192_c0_g1~~TRINITY_DN87192_c0_g1_i1.p1  ORF type:complete len:396 (-),score=66.79 TRINITY_DN87192_c0_g1_i1:88-1275(-)
MDVVDSILNDWQSCRPSGSVLAEGQLAEVRRCLAARAKDEGAGNTTAKAVQNLENLLLERSESSQVVHFLRFWQTMHEVSQRLQDEAVDRLSCEEPFAVEVAAFRNLLLCHFDKNRNEGVSCRWLEEQVQKKREESADEASWAPLQEAVQQVRAVSRQEQRMWWPGQPSVKLRLDELSALLLPWLQEAVEDYCRGSRSAQIFCVRDVAGCSRRDACLYLGRSGWDVEAALQRFFVASSEHLEGESAWSSGGAKLRKNEVDCPICAVSYAEGFKAVETKCCFQVLCGKCHSRLTDSNGDFACPFCRGANGLPCHDELSEGSDLARTGSVLPPTWQGRLSSATSTLQGRLSSVTSALQRAMDRSPISCGCPSEAAQQLAPACLFCMASLAFGLCTGH